MNNLYKNQKGFSALELVLVLIIVVLIVVVGWLVYQNHNKITSTNKPTSSTASKTSTKPTTNKSNSSAVSYKTYTDSAAQASFQYPSNWNLASIRGLCDEPNGCSPSTDSISAEQITSPDNSVKIIWSGISGVGGYCNNKIPPTQSGGCTIETVFSSTPIPKANGLYVVEGAMEVSSGQYQPFLAVQDKNGVLTSGEPGLFYQSFTLPSTNKHTLFNMNNTYKDGGGGGNTQTYATKSQVQSYLSSVDVTEAKQILMSLSVN